MFEVGEDFQQAKQNCLSLKDTSLDAIEVDVFLQERTNRGFLVNDGRISFELISSEIPDFVKGKKIKVLLECRKEGLLLKKREEMGNLRILKVGVSLLGMIVALFYFFREFRFGFRKNAAFFTLRNK